MYCEVFKATTDNWYPSYIIERSNLYLVRVVFTQTGPNPPISGDWRVCVWGADDCGMERDFKDETSAWSCFVQVLGLDDVTKSSLKLLGFISA